MMMTALWIGLAFAGGAFAGASWAVWTAKARRVTRGPVVGSTRWWEEMERRMYR